MIGWLAFIGVATALLGGFEALDQETVTGAIVWGLIGFGGAGLLVLAIFLKSWGLE